MMKMGYQPEQLTKTKVRTKTPDRWAKRQRKMTHEMQMMANEFIKRDLSIKVIIEIMLSLSNVLNDRKMRHYIIQRRFLEDNAKERKITEERIKFFEDAELEDRDIAEAVLRKYELNYDVDELLGI